MRTIIFSSENNQHVNLLMELARQLNFKVKEVLNTMDEKTLNMKMAESSFAEDWNKPEDDVWDEFLKNAADVSAR